MKISEIVKPSNLADFLRLQVSCLSEDVEVALFLARFDCQQHHLPGKPVFELIAAYEISQTPALQVSFLVTDKAEQVLALFEKSLRGKQIAAELGIAWVELHKGLLLQAVNIAKPWGQEIWYTGIEQRGVSQVQSVEGCSPLDWVIAAAPSHILGAHKTPILLKILDPLPDEVFGDLYFEMHEEKQEVYVVTHIDSQAWPDGEGGIRFGFNQTLRSTFASDQDFKQAYLHAVDAYRKIRQQIDTLLDKQRAAEKIGLNAPVMPDKIKAWQQALPDALIAEEKKLRDEMENFIAVKKLHLGDVIKVPCFTPHSLQHGVRTVEFQTPVYERKILSFAQKVLTQDHWDTEAALQNMDLNTPESQSLVIIEKSAGLCREQVVRFDDFSVERITLAKKASIHLPASVYRLILLVSGELMIDDAFLSTGEAKLLPAQHAFDICSLGDNAVMLLAEPI